MKIRTINITLILGFAQLANLSLTRAQSVLQGDTIYQGLQAGKSTQLAVVSRMGQTYKKEELLGAYSAKLRNGECVSGTYVSSYAFHYRKKGTTFHVNKKKNQLTTINFGRAANIISAKGIQPGQHTFADVLAKYGVVDLNKKDNRLPNVQEVSHSVDGKRWFTILAYPGICFVSFGRRIPGENLLLRPVEEIWLNAEFY